MRPGRWGVVLAFVLVSAAATSGCAPPCYQSGTCDQTTPDENAKGNDLVCTKEAMTGTHIKETRCYRRAEVDERREKDRAAMERLMINANRPVKEPTPSGN
jgi:hypothetical protein